MPMAMAWLTSGSSATALAHLRPAAKFATKCHVFAVAECGQKLREQRGQRSRKRVAVAAARRLAVDLWRIQTGQCPAQKLGLQLITAKV